MISLEPNSTSKNQRTPQSVPPTAAFAGRHPSLANSGLLRRHNIRLPTLMPSPSPPPANALSNSWPPKEAPPLEQRKVRAECEYAVEQVLADCVPPPPTKQQRRRVSRPSERYRNSEKEADDPPPSLSRGKSSSVENRLASSMQMPMPCETHDMQGRQPAEDAGQSSSTVKKATFSLAMTKEEITEDFTAMRLQLPTRRLRKVRNSRFKHLYPGSGFPKVVTPDQYTVNGWRNG